MYKIFLLCLVVLFGCSKNTPVSEKKETSSKSYESSPDVTVSYVSPEEAYEPIFEYEYNYEPLPEEEIERLTLILHEQEERYLKGGLTEILSIYKFNFGIPDGDNYLVLWTGVRKRTDGSISSTSKDIYLYSISDKIEFSYFTRPGFPITEYTNFDIMENIPGIHIGTDNGTSVFDCNGDGIDELFFYGFSGRGNFISIKGYDAEKNKIVDYCNELRFEIIDKDKGPAPLEFTYYKNRNGFKVYGQFDPSVPPKNLIDNYYAWYFYAWNSKTRKYENIDEYLQDDTDTKYNIHSFSLDYFKNRIQIEGITGGFESLTDFVEIKANNVNGRSFNATVRIHTGEIYERIFDFDSNGHLHKGDIIMKE